MSSAADIPQRDDAFWGKIVKHYDAKVQPADFSALPDSRLVRSGRYIGRARSGDGLDQLTDSARWAAVVSSGVRV